MPHLSKLRVLTQESSPAVEEHHLLHSPNPLPAQSQLQLTGLPTPGSDAISLSKHYSQIALILRSFISPTCRSLDPEDVKPIGCHPIAAGWFANIWEAVHGDRKVVLKSYRCYVAFDVAQVAMVCCDCNLPQVMHS